MSEIESKQSMQIRVLNQEEIEKMRVACRVCTCTVFVLFICYPAIIKIIMFFPWCIM